MTERIGIIVGWEDSFPHAFIDKVKEMFKAAGVKHRKFKVQSLKL